MKIYVVGHSKNNFLPLDNIREKFLIDQKHEGDNIDFLNPWYCELTGLYYLWKHCNDDIVGLEHYRRYFVNNKKQLLSENEIRNILKNNDAIAHLSNDIGTNIYQAPTWCNSNHISMMDFAKRVLFCLRYNYPEYKNLLMNLLNQRKHWQGNMIICKKEILNNYCQWLFEDFLIKFKEFNLNDMPKRTFGYMTELFLFPFWCLINNIKIYNSKRIEI